MSIGQISQICSSDYASSQCSAAAQNVKASISQYAQQGTSSLQQYAQQNGLSQSEVSQLSSVNYAQIVQNLKAGVDAIRSGAPVSNAQVQSAFATAAATAAVIGGATLGTGLVIAGIAAAFYAGSIALSDAIEKLLGVTNGPTPCDPSKYPSNPKDPRWIHASDLYVEGPPSSTTVYSKVKNEGGYPEPIQFWLPYTTGSFENWARPALFQYSELALNCQYPAGICGIGQMLVGLVATWNSMFPSGTKTRTIAYCWDVWAMQQGLSSVNNRTTINPPIDMATALTLAQDPIQKALMEFRQGVDETDYSNLCTVPSNWNAPLPISVVVADPPTAAVATLPSVVGVTAAGLVGGLAAGAGYMWWAGTLTPFLKKVIAWVRP